MDVINGQRCSQELRPGSAVARRAEQAGADVARAGRPPITRGRDGIVAWTITYAAAGPAEATLDSLFPDLARLTTNIAVIIAMSCFLAFFLYSSREHADV